MWREGQIITLSDGSRFDVQNVQSFELNVPANTIHVRMYDGSGRTVFCTNSTLSRTLSDLVKLIYEDRGWT